MDSHIIPTTLFWTEWCDGVGSGAAVAAAGARPGMAALLKLTRDEKIDMIEEQN